MSDPERGRVFGQVAEQYERARPSYPDALIADVVALAPAGRVVEIGAGTGKATRLVAPHVAELTAIEPDREMAAILARTCAPWPYVRIEHASFEDFEGESRTVDAVISGQAWHWVDPAQAIPKVVKLVRPGGCLAPFWNRPRYEEHPIRELDEIYERLAPDLKDSVTAGVPRPQADRVGVDVHADRIRESGLMASVEIRTYDWDETRTAAEYVDLLGTHSNHVLLEPERRTALHGAVAEAIENAGGAITIPHRSYLIVALNT
jgi:SAM-dependent methyltransferase